ncbi:MULTISPECIES: nuclear transport factor 2 family protein [Acinetobacter]|uniref:nuclear transport factor 2 family protein n=1 Tax=Acinetobacter TaxID=469 RepID=UPI00157BA10E|nr:nuclear transport factor 2 family protein [Acinetobacter radioresistens]MCK4081848.1 SnoaL-like domain-containing protein [Acinetobacter radioresistens]MCK4111948.1 SnoaL-like domain-containing protein [Acinetobacter radioresistens]MCU4383971.1 nuclear transport factor 2 family protein [Acinetobacter radioresistens]MCU4500632.1 nuclear transport factor 2 family protein [Acinetobacter radioresistens]NTY98208.1 polyketide cyclase [Acinetobacter radioresistens]
MNQQEIKALVGTAHHELFSLHDTSALERYFSADFIEHSPLVADGLSGLRQLVQDCPNLKHEAVRILADGDLVAIHGCFEGLDEQPLVGFDIYRVKDGKIVEHWDGLVPEAAANLSGRTQLDGPTEVAKTGQEEHNQSLVKEFFTRTLIEGDYEGFRDYANGELFQQHSPDIGDGTVAVIDFLNKIRNEGQGLLYSKIHRTIADGQFVLTHSEGSIAGTRHAYFELWRVEDGKIVELWDAIAPVPQDDQAVHRYGVF